MNRQSGAPMECRGVLAYRDHRLDEVVVYASTQTPHTMRVALGEILGIEERCIRVVAPDVGGGFGPEGAALSGRDHPRRAGACSSTIRCAGSRIATSIC